jgi:hypothetical protein
MHWGCKESPRLFKGTCDQKPECWGTEKDPKTGCLKPALLCRNSCLTDLLGDAFLDPSPDAGTDAGMDR